MVPLASAPTSMSTVGRGSGRLGRASARRIQASSSARAEALGEGAGVGGAARGAGAGAVAGALAALARSGAVAVGVPLERDRLCDVHALTKLQTRCHRERSTEHVDVAHPSTRAVAVYRA